MQPAGSARAPVWITGAGAVTPLGVGRKQLWAFLQGGGGAPRSAPAAAAGPSACGLDAPGPASTLAAAGFMAEAFADGRYLRRLSGLSRSALVAARLALLDAAYPADPEVLGETAVVLGTGFGSSNYHFEYYEALFRRGLKEASPLLFSESVMNAASGHVSQYLGLRGPSLTVVGGEDVGIAAAASALDKVRLGVAPAALAGGAEEYSILVHRALVGAGVVSAGGEASAAVAFSEGAVLALLERPEAARRRGSSPVAAVLGAGSGRAAAGSAPSGDHVARAVEEACRDAGVEPGQVDLVVGGADGGELDAPELRGLLAVLDRKRPVLLSAPKRILGEGFGYSSAALVLLAAMALETREAPPSWTLARALETEVPEAWRGGGQRTEHQASLALALASTRRGGAWALVLARAGG